MARYTGAMVANSPLLPLRYMARRLAVPQKWLRAEAEAGRVPHLDADGQILFHPDAVIDVLTQRAAQMPQDGKEAHDAT